VQEKVKETDWSIFEGKYMLQLSPLYYFFHLRALQFKVIKGAIEAAKVERYYT